MFGHTHYVPILRWKRGEQIAIRELFWAERSRITPLVEVVDEHNLHRTAEQIAKAWGQERLFLDLGHFATKASHRGGDHPVTGVLNSARMLGLAVIPVTALAYNRTYQDVVRTVSEQDKRGACVRLFRSDLRSSNLAADLDGLVSSLRLNPSSVDLVVDLQIIDKAVHDLAMICSVLPDVLRWRTLTVASGAFPKNLAGLSVGQHHLPRLEWQSWRKQVTSHLPRRPTYGDYATLHPYLLGWFPGMNVSASIRYTIEESWLIMRGEGLRNEGGAGYAQYPANAELLCYNPEYCGPDFSFGDRYIYEIASKKQKTGTPETWLTAGVNHHLTFVARQIASLFGI